MYNKILELNKCQFTPINQNKDPEKWLLLRTTGIGGSDAGAIMGLNEFCSPLQIYLSKKGHNNFDGNAATEWGHILENPIMEKTSKDLEISIEAVPGMFTSKENIFMNANLDGVCFAESDVALNGETVCGLGGYEIKTSANGQGFSSDEIPDSYYCQVQHYMAVTGLDWFILTVFILSQRIAKHYIIRRNDMFISDLITEESNFWNNHIICNIPPEPTGNERESELIKSLPYPESIELSSEFEELLEEKSQLDEQINDLKKKSEIIKEKILIEMSMQSSDKDDTEKTTASCGRWKITLNKQIRKTVDIERLKDEGIYETYTKNSVSKVLRISKSKNNE